MIGKIDFNNLAQFKEYKELIGQGPLTAGHVWLNRCWCDHCCTLYEVEEGRHLAMNICRAVSKEGNSFGCGGNKLLRPPAYGPMQLKRWCEIRSRPRNLNPFYLFLTDRIELDREMDHPSIIVPPRLREREPTPSGDAARQFLNRSIDWEKIKREFPVKQEDLTIADQVEEGRQHEAFRKLHDIDQDKPKLEEPKRPSVIKPW